ncbi:MULTISPECIES: hypothetical protein [Nostoc]|uniref:Uncharacterized protein n=2 Tax=Nostoc TaxID=1177 RepID=A0ABR8III0_9NOSO|nr:MULTISPECIES: hypothetical protein [Nostoc]MBD2565326.1 hypothetical protein [Nostoc linckia FACHB-391]MBD2650998.1 hypothetical protein [Nostoc foliaceum FACHB-393]
MNNLCETRIKATSPSAASSPLEKLTTSVVNFINSLSQSFKLSERELLVQKQWLHNMQTSQLLKEQQDFINEANQKMPILLTSKSRLIILEAILVTRARNGQPIDDLVTAIEVVRKNVLEIDIQPNLNLEKEQKTQPQKTKHTLITHRHQYDLPILIEVGNLITDARNLILIVPLIAALFVLILPITSPRICNSWENTSGTYENKSLFCQLLGDLNRFFQDYQKLQ